MTYRRAQFLYAILLVLSVGLGVSGAFVSGNVGWWLLAVGVLFYLAAVMVVKTWIWR